jgi:hypothetical protein
MSRNPSHVAQQSPRHLSGPRSDGKPLATAIAAQHPDVFPPLPAASMVAAAPPSTPLAAMILLSVFVAVTALALRTRWLVR